MAGSLTSTDSSKTLSISNGSGTPALTSILTHAPHEFLQPSGNAIQDAALNLVKQYFDPLMKSTKGNGLDTVYLEGFDVEQVWEQVRGVVEMLAQTAVDDAKSGEEEEFAGFGEEEEEEDESEDEAEDGIDYGSDEEGEEEDPEEKEFVKDVHGLNDGFFSIEDFNRQTELLELQDARSGPVDEDDDEDDIDYHADPTTLQDDDEEEEEEFPTKSKTNGHLKDDYENDDDDEMDLDRGMDENANDIMYEDFFAPPAKKKTGKEGVRKMDPEAEYAAVQSDMERSDEDAEMGGDPADPMNRRSSHQKRQAALMEQIRELEAQNVAKKEWVMGGEAKARDRPLNSLLEEDLDFERSGKPVPVITQERRILNAQFDEFRRGRVELDDSKPQESLAEDNPDASDEKLQKEHKEIETIWIDVSRKLDALTSWNFTPKPPKPSLAIVSDVAAISMEEAQPSASAGGIAANVSMLAPQEIYKPGKDKAYLPIGEGGGREIVGKSGAPISTREMSSDDKKRRRRREKEKIRKRNAAEGIKRGDVKAGSKKDVVDTLKRGNVAIIGKGGEKRSVDGKMVTERSKGTSASLLKL
ncbi:Mpp10 protein-domain-containing protein [Trichophaea hybrida]|nr:Mpp10 protein-domain-containing protein [Trichophaea hybrida]